MVKELISKMKNNNKIPVVFVLIIMLILGDLALVIIDQLFGKDKGIIFGYRLINLIFISIIMIGLLSYAYFSFDFVKRLEIRISVKIKRKISNLIISIISVVVFISFIEVVFYFMLKFKHSTYTYSISKGIFRNDPILGAVLRENIEDEFTKLLVDPSKHDTSVVFKTTIRTDSLGNRLIDIPGMQNRKKFAIFFGCSFTFGAGVEDTQTIPYNFAKYDTNFCAYNFGVGGYGPNNMLAKLQFTDLRKIVKQDSGICFYIYMIFHPQRVIGDMQTYTTYGPDMPYYGYKHDSLFYYGSFRRNRKFLSGFYTIMGKSNVVKYFKINFPNKLKPKHYKLTCDIIYHSYLEYRQQFHNDNFYVIIYPTTQREILDYLKNYNIKVLDFSKLFNAIDDQYSIKLDRHPSVLACRVFAEHLVDTLHHIERKN